MMIIIETNLGNITIRLDHDNTPNTAANFQQHVEAGFYDNTIFHRVIDKFMVQGGGFEPGMVAKDKADEIDNEAENAKPNLRGTVAMARTSMPHSASSQFFINTVDNKFLNFRSASPDGFGYCVFGEVVEGMDVVDQISKVATGSQAGHQDVPLEDIVIIKANVQVEATNND
jgi:peptidyl-prolyl cis-trans isomerase B (cyclophilin B)